MRRALLLAAIFPLALASVAATDASDDIDTKPEEHCVVQVLGEDAKGNFILGPEVCFKTFTGVLTHVGAEDVDPAVTPATATRGVLASNQLLGVHYIDSNLEGSSLTVWGTNCSGGGLNLSANWDDELSSTAHGLCGTIKHYELFDYDGSVFPTTSPWKNITGVMNDETSSIRYFS